MVLKRYRHQILIILRDTTNTAMSASYIDLHLEISSKGRIRTKLYDKRDDFNFLIVNFSFIYSNIPATPAYGVYISLTLSSYDIPELVVLIRF